MYSVLVIDDEKLTRQTIIKILNENFPECNDIYQAENAPEGIDKIKEFNPNIIITDICLGQMSGLDMLELLNPKSKVIVLTGYRDFEYAQRSININVSAFLLKPIRPSVLIDAVSSAISKIDEESSKRSEFERLNTMLENNLPYIRQKILLDIIYGISTVDLTGSHGSLDVYDISGDKVRFPKDKSNEFVSIKDGGVYICRRIADEFSLSQGDSLTFSPFGSDEKYTVKVLGIIRSVTESMVMTPGTYESLGLDFKPDSIYTDTDKNNIPAGSAIKSVQSKQMIIDSFDTFTELMDMMIYLLIGGALLLGVVVLYNLGVMSYTERYREMATLKVVGFRNNRIGRLLIGQNLFISIVGSVIGLPLGILILDYLLKKLAGEYETELSISPFSCVLSLVLTVGMSLAVGFTVAGKNRRIDMVEALKCAE